MDFQQTAFEDYAYEKACYAITPLRNVCGLEPSAGEADQ